MKTNSILTFIAGAAIGAGLALLFAPASGEETRKKIKEKAEEGYNSIRERMNAASAKAEE